MRKLRSIAVFCGSSAGKNDEYRRAARLLGQEMAKRKIALVYGGGTLGLMGEIAKAVSDQGGTVKGFLPKAMDMPSVRPFSINTEEVITEDMHERKKAMYEASDAFIALPGGIGTLEEISEIYTWKQLGYHTKNVALFNINGYWDPLIAQLDRGVEEGFISEAVRSALIVEENALTLLDKLESESIELPSKI